MGGQRNKRKESQNCVGVEHLKIEIEECTSTSETSSANFVTTDTRSVETLMSLVINEDMLREMIVAHVIRDEIRNGSSRKDMCSLRLVAKSWLQDVSKCLFKSGEPLLKIVLKKENCVNASLGVHQNGGKLLDQVTTALTSSTRVETKIPPICLKICADFFRDENLQSFSNFLTACASGLVELEMSIPGNGGSMTFLFPGVNLTFPNLHKFTVNFPRERIILEENEATFCSGSNSVALLFIQSILNGAEKLKELNFSLAETQLPAGLRYLSIPPTLTVLNISGFPFPEVLLNYDLPLLQKLNFRIFSQRYAEGLVSRILEKFKASLHKLFIFGPPTVPNPPLPLTIIRFPLMDKLEVCFVEPNLIALEAGHPPLATVLPKLKTLALHSQAVFKVENWIESSTFSSVIKLSLDLNRSNGRIHSLDLRNHFPNLESLSLRLIDLPEKEEMAYIFSEMTQLKHLCLNIPKGWPIMCTRHQWDSILTGIPSGLVGELLRNPEFWSKFQLKNEMLPSIVNMKELTKLSLQSPPITDGEEPLISDLAFKFGFMEMPKLKTLNLTGKFKASSEMTRAWQDRGCTLEDIDRLGN